MYKSRITAIALLTLVPFAHAQNEPPPLEKAPIGEAEKVEDIEGARNLTRDGAFYFAGQPDEAALRELAARGVKIVVNIRRASEMERVGFDEAALLEELGIKYLQIPVAPDSFSAADVEAFAEAIEGVKGSALIHCASSNRVGGFWAAYLHRKRGVAWPDALAKGKAAGLRAASMERAAERVAQAPEK